MIKNIWYVHNQGIYIEITALTPANIRHSHGICPTTQLSLCPLNESLYIHHQVKDNQMLCTYSMQIYIHFVISLTISSKCLLSCKHIFPCVYCMLWWSTPFWWGSCHTCCAQLWQWQWVCKKYISEINIKILCMYLKLIHETVTLHDFANQFAFIPAHNYNSCHGCQKFNK